MAVSRMDTGFQAFFAGSLNLASFLEGQFDMRPWMKRNPRDIRSRNAPPLPVSGERVGVRGVHLTQNFHQHSVGLFERVTIPKSDYSKALPL